MSADQVRVVELVLARPLDTTADHHVADELAPRLLPWEKANQAVEWVACTDLCGTYLPLGRAA